MRTILKLAFMAVLGLMAASCGDEFNYPSFMPTEQTVYAGQMDAVMNIHGTDYPVDAVDATIAIKPEGDGVYTLSIAPFSMYFDGGFIKGDIVVYDEITVDGIEAEITSTNILLNKRDHRQDVRYSMRNGEIQVGNEMQSELNATLNGGGLEATLYVHSWGTLPGTLTLRFKGTEGER